MKEYIFIERNREVFLIVDIENKMYYHYTTDFEEATIFQNPIEGFKTINDLGFSMYDFIMIEREDMYFNHITHVISKANDISYHVYKKVLSHRKLKDIVEEVEKLSKEFINTLEYIEKNNSF